jgi:hypothetical protein
MKSHETLVLLVLVLLAGSLGARAASLQPDPSVKIVRSLDTANDPDRQISVTLGFVVGTSGEVVWISPGWNWISSRRVC